MYKNGRGGIFETRTGGEKHEQYHCGNEENAYRNNSKEGIIDRRTPYGFGIPNNDKMIFNDVALLDTQTHHRKCNYKRGKYQRYQVFGHIAAANGYESRVPNERCDILLNEKFNNQTYQQKPINLKNTNCRYA